MTLLVLSTPRWFSCNDIFTRLNPDMFGRDSPCENDGPTWWTRLVRARIGWKVGDAGDSEIVDLLGLQDMVVANNFLCHMDGAEAERCLRNIGRLVRLGGYLFVFGIETDVREKAACDSGWRPIEEIHEGDLFMRGIWPRYYAVLERLNKRRADWKIRYASGFQVISGGATL
jgi:hypothetical protein